MGILNKLFYRKKIIQHPDANASTNLIYRFLDASVPPQYHRSYTIDVTPKNVTFSVDVYGTILLKQLIPLKKEIYQSFRTDLQALDLKEKKEPNTVHPVGGETEYLTVIDQVGKEINGKIFNNRFSEYNTLEGNVAAAIALFKNLVPRLQKRIDSTK